MLQSDYDTENFMLAGYAGTGKTTIAENIITYASNKGIKVTVLAPTNKAASVLRAKLNGVPASFDVKTLHSALYGQPDENGEWVPSSNLDKGLVLVDESSMITTKVLEDLRSFLAAKSLLVFLGDSFQLEPVGDDPKLFAWKGLGFKQENYIELTEVKRQGLDSNILKVATCMRLKKEAVIPTESYEDFTVALDSNQFYNKFLDSIANGEDAICIVSTNKTRVGINERARRKLFGFTKEPVMPGESLISVANSRSFSNSELFKVADAKIEKTFKITLDFGSRYKPEPKVVDIVIVSVIPYGFAVPITMFLAPTLDKPTLPHQFFDAILQENRKQHTLRAVNALTQAEFGFNKGAEIPEHLIEENDNGKLSLSRNVVIATYGYGITAHKSQGSQWDKVFINLDWYPDDKHPARWIYTAVTRAVKEVCVLKTRYVKALQQKELDLLFEQNN